MELLLQGKNKKGDIVVYTCIVITDKLHMWKETKLVSKKTELSHRSLHVTVKRRTATSNPLLLVALHL